MGRPPPLWSWNNFGSGLEPNVADLGHCVLAKACQRNSTPPQDRAIDLLSRGTTEMSWLLLLSYFFGGIFLANAVPHVVSGMMGRPFQSPFARPPGEGLSSSTVNVLWGFFNIVIGYVLVFRVGDFELRETVDIIALGAGAFLIALFSARHFGRFNGGNAP